MQSKSSKWIGHGIYVLIMTMLIGAVYFSGKSINYNWHWDRLYRMSSTPKCNSSEQTVTVLPWLTLVS